MLPSLMLYNLFQKITHWNQGSAGVCAKKQDGTCNHGIKALSLFMDIACKTGL